jgi:hypothetical protein
LILTDITLLLYGTCNPNQLLNKKQLLLQKLFIDEVAGLASLLLKI